MYICDCPDHASNLNTCKHIHTCVSILRAGQKFENQDIVDQSVDDLNWTLIKNALQVIEKHDNDRGKIIQKTDFFPIINLTALVKNTIYSTKELIQRWTSSIKRNQKY